MKNYKDRNSLRTKHVVNSQIKDSQIRLITETGDNLGLVPTRDAMSRAESVGLDLVKIGEQDSVTVAKIMDFGKYLYIKKKQQGEAKKRQKTIQIKEVKFRPNIGDQDYMVKFKRALEFLHDGKRVKFTLQFRGREKSMMREIGTEFFQRIDNDLKGENIASLVAEKEQRGKPFWSKVYFIKGI